MKTLNMRRVDVCELTIFIDIVCSLSVFAAPDYDKSSWISVKETMDLPFPNVSEL